MLCTFCGMENRPESKFCGMCGVSLERRKVERRLGQGGVTLRCQSCGHENELRHTFCAWCGTRVDRRVQERRAGSPEQQPAVAMANAQLPAPEGAENKESELQPAIANGELSAPEAPGKKESELQPPLLTPAQIQAPAQATEAPSHPKPPPAIFRSEPANTSSSSMRVPSFLGLNDPPKNQGKYLLEGEGSSRGVLRKLALVAILAALLGWIFVPWHSIFRASPRSAAPPKTEPAATPSPQGQKQSPASQNTENPAANGAPDSSPAPVAPNDASNSQSPGQSDESNSSSTAGADEISATDAVQNKKAAALKKQKAAESALLAQRKPSAALLRAQQYIEGKGVAQNCEQGLLYLTAATRENEAAAAAQMGALYASGQCVQQDRVAAYRWLNTAHKLDPGNARTKKDMDRLRAEMSPLERRQAGQ